MRAAYQLIIEDVTTATRRVFVHESDWKAPVVPKEGMLVILPGTRRAIVKITQVVWVPADGRAILSLTLGALQEKADRLLAELSSVGWREADPTQSSTAQTEDAPRPDSDPPPA